MRNSTVQDSAQRRGHDSSRLLSNILSQLEKSQTWERFFLHQQVKHQHLNWAKSQIPPTLGSLKRLMPKTRQHGKC